MSAPWVARAREMRAAGHRLSDIVLAVGVGESQVWRAISDVPFKAAPRACVGGAQIPPWVRRAGLVEDFRDVAHALGEHEAAAHCRRLTAAMRAGA